MPEHQEQEATITHFVPATLRRLNQSFDLTRGEGACDGWRLSRPWAAFPVFSPFRPFMFFRQLGCEKGPLRIVDLAQRSNTFSLEFWPVSVFFPPPPDAFGVYS
jgi:hypothetical protein